MLCKFRAFFGNTKTYTDKISFLFIQSMKIIPRKKLIFTTKSNKSLTFKIYNYGK